MKKEIRRDRIKVINETFYNLCSVPYYWGDKSVEIVACSVRGEGRGGGAGAETRVKICSKARREVTF